MTSIAICCPNRDDFRAEAVASYTGLAVQAALLTGRAPAQILPQTCFVDKSRNEAWRIARDMGVDWLLYMDSDVALISDAQDILARMIEQDRDVLSGLYVDRAYPYRPHIYQFCPRGVQSIPGYPGEPFQVQATGAGFMLISKRVMDAFTPEVIEQYGLPFNFLNYGLPNELREDVAFCWRLAKLGFELWIDPRIKLAHLGKHAYTTEHWERIKGMLEQADNPLEGWLSPAECIWLRGMAKRMPGGIVEIGSWKGRSTKELLDSGHPVTAVDHWKGSPDPGDDTHSMARREDVFEQFKANVGHYENLNILKMSSTEAARHVPDAGADMVFIDASHNYADIKADIAAWRPKAHRLICGHDYAPGWPGVVRAVDEAFPAGVKTVGSIWFKEL